ncbi:hypothetical protein BDR26DRAFT_559384, partial [Obelidium mucronatum]
QVSKICNWYSLGDCLVSSSVCIAQRHLQSQSKEEARLFPHQRIARPSTHSTRSTALISRPQVTHPLIPQQDKNKYTRAKSTLADLISPSTLPNGTRLIALPAIVGGVGISYNLPGITQNVRLSRTVLPRIFDGTITMWNDADILKENPFLANVSNLITVVVRSSTSGTSQNLFRGLALMDASTGYPNTPFTAKGYKLTLKNSFTAANTVSAAIIVGSVPYTLTYLTQVEAKDLEIASPTLTTTALIQHPNGDFVEWSFESGQLAINAISTAELRSLNKSSSAISLMDKSVKGAYPWTIVSNIVIDPSNIASDYETTIWTLRFLLVFGHESSVLKQQWFCGYCKHEYSRGDLVGSVP